MRPHTFRAGLLAGCAGIALVSLSACGDDSDSAAPVTVVTETVTASASPSPTTEAVEALSMDDVHEWLLDNIADDSPLLLAIPADNNSDLNSGYVGICAEADGQEPSASFMKDVESGLSGDDAALEKRLAFEYVDYVVEACRATGHAEEPIEPWKWNPKKYKFPGLVTAVHEAGFDDLLEGWFFDDIDPSSDLMESCRAIDNQKPGSTKPVKDRKAWYGALTDYKDRGRFVDTVFEACYSTGNARRYVPPPPSFVNGTFRIGKDIPAGVYRTVVPRGGYGCYWERLRGFSGNFSDIIANDNVSPGSPTIVTIYSSDVGFSSSGCGKWVLQR